MSPYADLFHLTTCSLYVTAVADWISLRALRWPPECCSSSIQNILFCVVECTVWQGKVYCFSIMRLAGCREPNQSSFCMFQWVEVWFGKWWPSRQCPQTQLMRPCRVQCLRWNTQVFLVLVVCFYLQYYKITICINLKKSKKDIKAKKIV